MEFTRLNLHEVLDRFKQNMDRQKELDRKLLSPLAREDWVECLKSRAVALREMFLENDHLIARLHVILSDDLSEETAAEMYVEARDMYLADYDDSQILLPLLEKLIAFYEEREDIARLLFLYGAAFYEENEIRNRREAGKLSVDYNLKALAYSSQYLDLPSVEQRKQLWVAYYNTIIIGLGNRVLDIETSWMYMEEVLALWNDTRVQQLDGSDPGICTIVGRILNEWLIVEEYIEDSSSDLKEIFCNFASDAFEREMREHKVLTDINSEVYAAYLHARVIRGYCTFDEIIDEYLEFYLVNVKRCDDEDTLTAEDSNFLINAPLTLERWLRFGTSEEKSKRVISILLEFTKRTWYNKLDLYAEPFLNEVFAQWCFCVLKYLDYPEEKEELFFQLLVRRQLPTFLHSVMMANLAVALCGEILHTRPELLSNIPNVSLGEMLDYVRMCGLLHDVGKTCITDIINTQGRKLWDREFAAIRLHPTHGANMIGEDKDLAKYHDVILGHHRFHDGTGGYPAEFNNTDSDYRVIIDLITICDCIDAATDSLGRNYKQGKTLYDVLEELVAGKGTRYNADLVSVIEQSKSLQDEMNGIVSHRRLDIMYSAYCGGRDFC